MEPALDSCLFQIYHCLVVFRATLLELNFKSSHPVFPSKGQSPNRLHPRPELCLDHWLPDDPQFRYEKLKDMCDDYFYLPARSEHRGTGGIFFDDMAMTSTSLAFVKGVAITWMPSWLPIVAKRQRLPYTDQQRRWQLLRRGRYLEFNLLYDRGTQFGLKTGGRTESILMSLPPDVAWEYNYHAKEGSREAEMMQIMPTTRRLLRL